MGDGLVAVVLEVVVVGHADEGRLQGVEAEVDGAERVGKQSCLGGFAHAWQTGENDESTLPQV